MSETKQTSKAAPMGRTLQMAINLIDRLGNLCAFGAAAAVVLLVLCVFVDVIGRKFFNSPFPGTLEMTANWWMPTLTLLAFAFTERRQEHIKVTLLLDALPLRMRQIVEGTFGILAVGLLWALTYYTLMDAIKSARIGETTPSVPPLAIWPFKFVAAFGVGVLALQSIATMIRHFAGHLPQQHQLDGEEDAL